MIEMFTPRWRKVVRDILENKPRTLLVTLAIAVGVFAFSGVFITRDVLINDMDASFREINPATITMAVFTPFEEGLERTIEGIPGVAQAEGRIQYSVQIQSGTDTWSNLDLFAVRNFNTLAVNTFEVEQGSFPPERREILLERTALAFLNKQVGDMVLVELPDGTQRELVIGGVVHDLNAIPANLFPQFTGYASMETVRWLGYYGELNYLNIVTDPDIRTVEEVQVVANRVTDRLGSYGYVIGFAQTLEPGRHWASDIVSGFVTVLGILGFLSLGLSAFLVINTISSILAQQKRQVGMMKAVGAQARQVVGVYLVMSGIFGGLALVIAVPVGYGLAVGLTTVLATFLNVNVSNFYIPGWVLAAQVLTAVGTPLLAAFVPVMMGTRITVREAVSDYGIGDMQTREGLIDRLITTIRGLPRPTMLSIRNTFRRKGRLALTLVTLTVAGAIFLSVLNLRSSVGIELDTIFKVFGYDVQMVFSEPQPVTRIQRVASLVPGVTRIEGWGFGSALPFQPDGTEGNDFTIFAPPIDTPFVVPTMEEGRWLEEGDTNKLVLSRQVVRDNPYLQVGDTVKLDVNGDSYRFEIVGIMSLTGPPFAYANFDYITRLTGAPGQSVVGIIGTEQHDAASQARIGRELQERFKRSGIPVSQTITTQQLIGAQAQQLDFFVYFMLFMAILLAIVGGLGLASTMSLNVMERTREIGVMRSIGAADNAVRNVFLTEGILIGMISWVLAAILSLPVSYAFATALGNAFFERPLVFSVSPIGFFWWLLIVLFVSSLASVLPSNRASRVSVRESLSYE
ncbi:MAG: FtsX-like permease family protein [Anaerolineae bacterium]|nr:FtsX-like permease family protein [Anaerolineae bacterium]